MPNVQLTDDPFVITGTDGNTYTITDPLEVMLELSKAKLMTSDGSVATDSESLSKIRDVFRTACGIPSLTFFQMVAIVKAMGNYVSELQKKMLSTPNSAPSTGLFQQAQVASDTTSTSSAFEH